MVIIVVVLMVMVTSFQVGDGVKSRLCDSCDLAVRGDNNSGSGESEEECGIKCGVHVGGIDVGIHLPTVFIYS